MITRVWFQFSSETAGKNQALELIFQALWTALFFWFMTMKSNQKAFLQNSYFFSGFILPRCAWNIMSKKIQVLSPFHKDLSYTFITSFSSDLICEMLSEISWWEFLEINWLSQSFELEQLNSSGHFTEILQIF